MRFASAMVLTLGAALAAGSVEVQAQEGLRGPGAAIGGFHLVAMPAIQRELGLDDSQASKAKAVAERMNARFGQDMNKLKGLNSDEKMKRVVTLAGPHYDEGMRQLKSFLKPAQVDRFDQILFQQRGPMAMLEPRIAERLQITNEQAQKVASLAAQAQNQQKSAIDAEGKGSKSAMIKVESIANEANEQAIAILSPEQKRTWARLVGPPFRPDFGGGSAPSGEPAEPPSKP